MKKTALLFFFITGIAFSLEIQSIDPLDFGEIVSGDKRVSIRGVGVYVKGKPNRRVRIDVPNSHEFEGNQMLIKVERKDIVLDSSGRGRFKLNVDLRLRNTNQYRMLTDNLHVTVKYSD